MPRLFTALEIPAALGESLSLLRGGLPGARWIDPENYHLTLRFIGDVDDEIAQRDCVACLAMSGARISNCVSMGCCPSAGASRAPSSPRLRRRSR